MTVEKKILVYGCFAITLQINKYKIYKIPKKSEAFTDVFEHELERERDNFDTVLILCRAVSFSLQE